jgi:fermentation-respiration switch protein FrsA (DUF1100 family)
MIFAQVIGVPNSYRAKGVPMIEFRIAAMQSLRRIGRFLLSHWPSTVLILLASYAVMRPHLLERRFVYFPMKNVDVDPRVVGLRYEEVWLRTEDGLRLHGWFVPRDGARTTLLVLHGNAGNIGNRVEWIEMLHRAGAHVLIFDYRGYGRSEGEPFEEGLYRDARSAYAWWTAERRSAGERLVLIGESLGGAVAVELAGRSPVAGLIVQSSFTNAWDMAKTILPLGLLQPLTGVRFDSAGRIGAITCPKLIIHGDVDEIIPFRLGKRLFELAAPPKDFYAVSGARHNDLPWIAGPEYVSRIARFIERF